MTDIYPDAPGFRAGAPETSRAAAESVADAAKTRSNMSFRFILSRGYVGATADEVADAFGWERYSSRPRLAELHKRGAIVDSGTRRTGVSGRAQAVWVTKQFGPDTALEGQGELFGAVAA